MNEKAMSELASVVADAIYRDAERYRWLRRQHWSEAPLCVVAQPQRAVQLGHDCPSLDRLDAAIDEAMAAAPSAAAPALDAVFARAIRDRDAAVFPLPSPPEEKQG